MIDNEKGKYVSCGIQTNEHLYENIINHPKNNIKNPVIKIYNSSKIINFFPNNNIKTINQEFEYKNLFKEGYFNENFPNVEGRRINQKKIIIPKIKNKSYNFPKSHSFIFSSFFQRHKKTLIHFNYNKKNLNINCNTYNINKLEPINLLKKITMKKNKSLNSFEKISTKNNGIFLNINLKNNELINTDIKNKNFKGNLRRILLTRNKSCTNNKNILHTFNLIKKRNISKKIY